MKRINNFFVVNSNFFSKTFFSPMFLGLYILAFFVTPCFCANDPLTALRHGMNYYEVLQALGPPSAKKSNEVKREEIWNYDGTAVYFMEGKVVAWSREVGMVSPTISPVSEPTEADMDNTVTAVATTPSDEAVRGVLQDILGEFDERKSEPEPKKDK